MKNNQNNNNKNRKQENKKGKKSKDILDTDFIINNFDTLIEKMKKGNINTPKRIAHFLAQGCYETGGFKHFKENLNYYHSNILLLYLYLFQDHLILILDYSLYQHLIFFHIFYNYS